jgi:hypothetical protein
MSLGKWTGMFSQGDIPWRLRTGALHARERRSRAAAESGPSFGPRAGGAGGRRARPGPTVAGQPQYRRRASGSRAHRCPPYAQSRDRRRACYLRFSFVAGAVPVIRYAKIHGTKHRPWLAALLAIALANKIARMVWAMMVEGERYKKPAALAA